MRKKRDIKKILRHLPDCIKDEPETQGRSVPQRLVVESRKKRGRESHMGKLSS